ncbi:MAG: ATP-binding cassette domain-containing protein [Microbacter sp.]
MIHRIDLLGVVPIPLVETASKESSIWFLERHFEKGKRYLISSESGKGKSTLFDFLYGRRHDFTGTILFDNLSIAEFRRRDWNRLRQHHISIVFQGFRLFQELTVWENLMLKNQLTHHLSPRQLEQWLEAVGIADKKETLLHFLSYGQQQRVAIVRAFCQPFDFLLMDEPFSHLDKANQQSLCQLITSEVAHRGAGLLLSSLGDAYFLNFDEQLAL